MGVVRYISQSVSNSTLISTLYKPIDKVADNLTRGLFKILDIDLNQINNNNPIDSAPSSFSFITSSFAFSLVALTIIINRIHNLLPPNRPSSITLNPFVRCGLRLPSLFLLLRAILLVGSVLAAENGFKVSSSLIITGVAKLIGWLTLFAGKSTLVEMLELASQSPGLNLIRNDSDVMFEVFIAVSLAVLTEAFVRALSDTLHLQNNFNMLSFSFLLHIHSTSTNSSFPSQLYTHLFLVLSELFSLHLSFTVPLLPSKLYITGFFSLIGQVFVTKALILLWKNKRMILSGAALSTIESGSRNWEGSVFLSYAPEMAFEFVIVLTIVLRFLAAFLRGEELTKEGILGHKSHYPDRNMDFGFSVIRYGSSCLESTKLAGLANELDPITFRTGFFSSSSSSSSKPLQISYVELTRGNNPKSGEILTRPAVGNEKDLALRRRGQRSIGYGNEIIAVDVKERSAPSDPMARNPDRFNELKRFFKMIWKIIYYFYWRVSQFVKLNFRTLMIKLSIASDSTNLEESWKINNLDEDDLEDEDFSVGSSSDSDSDSDQSNSNSDEEQIQVDDEEEEEEQKDSTLLYRDLTSPTKTGSRKRKPINPQSEQVEEGEEELVEPQSSDFLPIFLAHQLNSNSNSPLTRRRYQSLLNPNSNSNSNQIESNYSTALSIRPQDFTQINDAEDEEEEGSEQSMERTRRRTCVICTTNERTIICFPCRCLSLCEECRHSITIRSNESSSLCVTCRTPVKGFSRIFIP